jgi:hypothetical protein
VIYTIPSGLATIDEKVTIGLVVDDGTGPWIKIGRVSDIIAIKMKIVTEKEPYLTLLLLQICHLDLFDIYVQVYINDVMAAQFQIQGFVFQKNISNEAVIMISQVLFPFRTHPGAVPIHPHSEPERVPF